MNKKLLQEILTTHDLDAIIATTPENVRYFAGRGLGREVRHNRVTTICAIVNHEPESKGYVVLPHTTLATLAQMKAANDLRLPKIKTFGKYFIQIGEETSLPDYAKEMVKLLQTINPCKDPVDAITQALMEMGVTNGRVGIDELGISPGIIAGIRDRLPNLRVVDAYDKIRRIRMVKTEEEVSLLKNSLQVLEAGIDQTLSEVNDQITQAELMRHFNRYAVGKGAVPILTNLRIGRGGGIPDPFPFPYQVKPGDLVTYDVVLELEGYHADSARTSVFGEPSSKQLTYYEAVLKGQEAALKTIKPGTRSSLIFETAVNTVRDSGIPHYNRNDVGHGIGVEVHELPIQSPESDEMLEANMVINVETPYYELGFGCVMIEDTVLVTETGFEYLSHADRKIRIIG